MTSGEHRPFVPLHALLIESVWKYGTSPAVYCYNTVTNEFISL
jgi:hypothetical protein